MRVIILILSVVILAGCQPEPDNLRLLDQLVVETHFDDEADFTQYETYTLTIDTVGFVSNRYPNDTIYVSPKNGDLARVIVSQLKSNIDAAGYQRVDKTADPDLGVNVFILHNINVFQEVVYGGYYPYDYYNYYSNYAYPYVQTYASNTGGLIIEVVDLKNKTPDNKVKKIWSAYMGDLIAAVDTEQQIKDGIDQAFIQSSYFTATLVLDSDAKTGNE